MNRGSYMGTVQHAVEYPGKLSSLEIILVCLAIALVVLTLLNRKVVLKSIDKVFFFWNKTPVLVSISILAAFMLAMAENYWVIIAAFILAVATFGIMCSGGHREESFDFLRSVGEVIVASVLATGLLSVILHEGKIALEPQHIVIAVALTIVLSGISIVARSTQIIRHARADLDGAANAFREAQRELRGRVGEISKQGQKLNDKTTEIQSAAAKTKDAAKLLGETLTSFNEEIEKAKLVDIAARALGLQNQTVEYPPLKTPIEAAMGTMRTWAESTRSHFPQRAGSTECGPAEASWWRCLECYHNEERYDLARFEMVTNARNYTYVLVAVLDQMRIAAGLKSTSVKLDDQSTAAPPPPARDIVIVQCSTFSPKDFYNFPKGPKDYREYRDVEFYGTYRRGVSFLNRQAGMLPHRIIFVAENHGSEFAEDHREQTKDEKEASKLERLGWAVDTRDAVFLGSSRLFCAPYSLPIPRTTSEDAPVMFFKEDWPEQLPGGNDRLNLGSRVGRGKEQICPVVPNLANAGLRTRSWERKARKQIAKALAGSGATGDEVDKILAKGPDDVRLPDVLAYLREREAWAWTDIVTKSRDDLQDAPESDFAPVRHVHNELQNTRDRLLRLAEKRRDADYEENICSRVQDLIAQSQKYDAGVEELRAKRRNDVDKGADWTNLRSMIGLQMGPGEAWLYHALNLVNALLFQELSPEGKLVPAWNLFSWDFLGLKTQEVASGATLTWEGHEAGSRTLKSRVRFVPVRPGSREDEPYVGDDGVLSALGFQSKCFEREFTLIGSRARNPEQGEKANPFEDVKWDLLVTCEMAPPYSTCRLNFHVHDGETPGVLEAYGNWVADTWVKTEQFSKGVAEDIAKEITATQGSKAEE